MFKIKKITAILLSLIAVLSVFSWQVFADESVTEEEPAAVRELSEEEELAEIMNIVGNEITYLSDEILPDEEKPDDIEKEKPVYAEDTVAVLYLCTNHTGFPSLGHIWIYIENVSDKEIKVGLYDLPAGEGVSVGTFGLTRSNGFGVYYNIEAYTGNLYGMEDSFSIRVEMNEEKMQKISKKILRANWWDPIVVNCAFFAITSWNKAGGKFMFPWVVFPVFARTQMKRRDYTENLEMFDPGRERVYKQKGFGENARLIPVKDGSVDTPPG